MTCHRIVAVLGTTAAIALGLTCKTADQQATRDANPEIAPAIPAVPPPPPPPPPSPPVTDAASEGRGDVADTDGAVPTKPGKSGKSGATKGTTPSPATDGAPRGRGMATLEVTGNLPKGVADQVLRAKIGSFATCHDGGQHGQVQIKVTMNDRGVVEIAKVMKSTFHGGETELCLAHVAGRFKFPPPPGGGESTVTFRLTF